MRKLLVFAALFLFAGVSFGQSLNKGGVFSIHEWTLKLNPDVSMNQFLEFWKENAVPVFEKAIPGATALILKGIRENNKYEYAGLYYYNSLEDLRKYWKEDGTPTEVGATASANFGPVLEKMSKFGDFTYSAKDWIILE